MIEHILSNENIETAYYHVLKNKGSAGIDGKSVDNLSDELSLHWREIKRAIRTESYVPQAILGIEIPKSNGKTRRLGIPTVVDRMLQQSIHQVLSPIFENDFQKASFGFRPNKNAQQALLLVRFYINKGFNTIIDIDLKAFFDEVSHEKLMTLLFHKVKCKTTLKLIRKFLRAPIQIDGKLVKRRKGVPQGSPLSPLLSNIMLNELDKKLVKGGHKFVRYADDFAIFKRSNKACKRVGNAVFTFLKARLNLPINREKSGIRKPKEFKFLGYRFHPSTRKGHKGKFHLIVDFNGYDRLKERIKWITRKTLPMSFSERIKKLNELMRGWLNYYKLASMHNQLRKLDPWIRKRLRLCIWKDWKKPNRKMKNLMRLGVNPNDAYSWSRTRMGTWAVACSPIMATTITLKRLEQRGYISMYSYYRKITDV